MRKGYGQFCPVAKAAEVLAERWTPLVMRELLEGSKHFNDLHRGVPLMSRSLLSLRLKQLEAVGAVERRSGQRGWEYHLTSAGNEISPIIQSLGEWGQRWYRSNFGPDDLDVGRLMWALRLTVRPEHFPPRRVTVQFDYADVPKNKRRWWVVSDRSDVDICPLNPGFEPDLLRGDRSADHNTNSDGRPVVQGRNRSRCNRAGRQGRVAAQFRCVAWAEPLRPHRGCAAAGARKAENASRAVTTPPSVSPGSHPQSDETADPAA